MQNREKYRYKKTAKEFTCALAHVFQCLDEEEFRKELNDNCGDELIEDLYHLLLEFMEKGSGIDDD